MQKMEEEHPRWEPLGSQLATATGCGWTECGPERGTYLEDRDSPMKISFRLLMGRRRGSEKFSGGVPEERHAATLDLEKRF